MIRRFPVLQNYLTVFSSYEQKLLIDFSLTVKAVTLIFIPGQGTAISSAKEGKSGFIYNFRKELISFLGRANVCAFHESPDCIYTDLTCINP